MKVLALDLGTSTTYVATCPRGELTPEMVEFFDGRLGVETALLELSDAVLIGSQALESLATLRPDERQGSKLWARFKPQLGVVDDAELGAEVFLRHLARILRSRHLGPEVGQTVIFGTPCDASAAYTQTLRRAAHKAGFGDVLLLEEPLAALVSALGSREIAASLALQPGLVIDFGGGTCDLASVRDLKPQSCASDWSLGGRLFDDLFFQLWAEQNPQKAQSLTQGDRAFLRLFGARQLKERFSQAMAQNPLRPFTGSLGPWGGVRDLTWDEFIQRARDYHPTEDQRSDVPTLPPALDLIGRFEQLLEAVTFEPQWVLAVGGSSLWPFVSQLLSVRWPQAKVLGSANPGGAVARGLAQLPAFQDRAAAASRALGAKVQPLVNRLAQKAFDHLAQEVCPLMAEQMASHLVGQAILPAMKSWAKSGGSLRQLEGQVMKGCEAQSPELEKKMAPLLRACAHRGEELLRQTLADWFADQGLRAPESEALKNADLTALMGQNFGLTLSQKLMASLTVPLRKAWALSFAAGGGLLALAFGAIAPLALGVLFGALFGAFAHRSPLGGWLMDRPVSPRRASKMAQSSALDQLTPKLERSLAQALLDHFEEQWAMSERELKDQLSHLLQGELAALNLVSALEVR